MYSTKYCLRDIAVLSGMANRIRLNRHSLMKNLCLPFTIGYHIEETTDSSQPIKRQDGFISGWVFLTLLLAIATTLSVVHWLTSYWSESIDKPTVQICAGLLQLFCCTFFLPILCNRKIRSHVSKSYFHSHQDRPTSCRKWTKKILPIIGITIFLTGMITLDIMKVAANSFCIDAYWEFDEYPYLLKEAIVAIIYHPIRIIFTSMVTVLCYMYIRSELCFYRFVYLRYMLLLVLVCVAWIWLDTQLTESLEGHVVEDAYSTGKYKTECPPRKTNFSNYSNTLCLCRATDTFQHVNKASDILYSFVIEYCLLVGECIMHMLFSMIDKTTDPLQTVEVRNNDDSDHRTEADMATGAEETRPLINNRQISQHEEPYRYHMQNVAWMENSYGDRQTDSTMNSYASIHVDSIPPSNENSLPSNKLTYFFIGLVLGLSFVILTAMQTFTDVNDILSFKVTYYAFKLFYHILAIILTARGFQACKNFRSKHRGYMGFEIFTLFSSFGFFVYVFFILQANIAELSGAQYYKPLPDMPHKNKPAVIVYMVDIIMNTIQVYTQSLFMLHSSKIKPPAERTSQVRDALYLFKQIILYLATCNFFIWGLESFVELQKVASIFPFHKAYYGEAQWQIISHLAYPLMIFYRFNSCIYLIGIHLSI